MSPLLPHLILPTCRSLSPRWHSRYLRKGQSLRDRPTLSGLLIDGHNEPGGNSSTDNNPSEGSLLDIGDRAGPATENGA